MARVVQDTAGILPTPKAAKGEPSAEPEGQIWDTADDEPESESDPGPEAEAPGGKKGQHPVCCICRASSKDRDAFRCCYDGVLRSAFECPGVCCSVCVVAVGAPALPGQGPALVPNAEGEALRTVVRGLRPGSRVVAKPGQRQNQ